MPTEGGVYNDGLIDISHSLFDANQALDGTSNEGDLGSGIAVGGGIFNGSDSTFDLLNSSVFVNRALGGPGGGGIYNLGILDFYTSLIFANFASISDDDCFGYLMPLFQTESKKATT